MEDDLHSPAPVVEGSVWYELHYRHAKAPTLMVDGALDRCARDDLMFTAGLAAPLEGGGVLVLDLDGVTSMDRFGARAVLELRSRARSSLHQAAPGQHPAVRNPSPSLDRRAHHCPRQPPAELRAETPARALGLCRGPLRVRSGA